MKMSGEVEIWLFTFLPRQRWKLNGKLHTPAASSRVQSSLYPLIVDQVSDRAGLPERKIPAL